MGSHSRNICGYEKPQTCTSAVFQAHSHPLNPTRVQLWSGPEAFWSPQAQKAILTHLKAISGHWKSPVLGCRLRLCDLQNASRPNLSWSLVRFIGHRKALPRKGVWQPWMLKSTAVEPVDIKGLLYTKHSKSHNSNPASHFHTALYPYSP